MCRSTTEGGRRCPHGSDGTRGCEYFDERMKKTFNLPDPPQTFPTIHKQNVEELGQKHSKEVLDTPVTPEQFDNFKQVVNKMIDSSDMSPHDKMIAKKQWNRTEKEVKNNEVTQVTLASWQKMMIVSALYFADKIGEKKRKVQWRQYAEIMNVSFNIKDFAEDESDSSIPPGYETREEFLEDLENAQQMVEDNPEDYPDDDDVNDDNENVDEVEEEYDEATENARYVDEMERREREAENQASPEEDIEFLPEETKETKQQTVNA